MPEEGESRLACLASVPWGLPSIEGHLPESGVPGELALLLALVPNNLGVERRVQSFRNAPMDNHEHLQERYWTTKLCGAVWGGKADDTEINPHETLVKHQGRHGSVWHRENVATNIPATAFKGFPTQQTPVLSGSNL